MRDSADHVLTRSARSSSAWVLFGLVLLLAGCATSTVRITVRPTPTPTPTRTIAGFDTLRVTRRALDGFPPFTPRTITDPTSVRRLYMAIQALPPIGTGASCPIDYGLRYDLAFSYRSGPAVQMEVDPFGCQDVRLPGEDYRQPDDAFWTLFAQMLGVPKASLFVHPT